MVNICIWDSLTYLYFLDISLGIVANRFEKKYLKALYKITICIWYTDYDNTVCVHVNLCVSCVGYNMDKHIFLTFSVLGFNRCLVSMCLFF